MLYIVFYKLKAMKKMASKILLLFALVCYSGIGFFILAESIQNLLEDLALNKIAESVKTTQENFEGIARPGRIFFFTGG